MEAEPALESVLIYCLKLKPKVLSKNKQQTTQQPRAHKLGLSWSCAWKEQTQVTGVQTLFFHVHIGQCSFVVASLLHSSVKVCSHLVLRTVVLSPLTPY